MDALWEIEAKLDNLSTHQAFLLLASAAFALILILCMATLTMLKKKAQKKHLAVVMASQHEEDSNINGSALGHKYISEPIRCGWGSIKRALTSSVRWSKARRFREERIGGSWRESATSAGPLLEKRIGMVEKGGWHSHNSESPVWQRPILMGEKCELPRFSGLILYDETGRPVCDSHQEIIIQEKSAHVARTTLRDLL